ncbi:MAG: GIY-YIG nuclease family protein [Ignavibacteriales bacterium]|nr:GIY-YIG nuclease family protein [Ignavibacteriales bacterium]
MHYFVYVLRSLKDRKLYIGQSNNLEDRLKRHNEGRVRATKSRLPFMLIYSEEFPTRADAVTRERYLKGLKGNSTFKRIIGV